MMRQVPVRWDEVERKGCVFVCACVRVRADKNLCTHTRAQTAKHAPYGCAWMWQPSSAFTCRHTIKLLGVVVSIILSLITTDIVA